MKEDYLDNLLTEMESRVAAMEEKLFGDEIESKSQQKRQVGSLNNDEKFIEVWFIYL